MYEPNKISDKMKSDNYKNHKDLMSNIVWEKIGLDNSIKIPWEDIKPSFKDEDSALNYLRTTATRKGKAFGFKFSVMNHREEGFVEIGCVGSQEVLKARPVGRPKSVDPETRAQRHSRAWDECMKLDPNPHPIQTIEWMEHSFRVELAGYILFNEYESKVENPQLVDIEAAKIRIAGSLENFKEQYRLHHQQYGLSTTSFETTKPQSDAEKHPWLKETTFEVERPGEKPSPWLTDPVKFVDYNDKEDE